MKVSETWLLSGSGLVMNETGGWAGVVVWCEMKTKYLYVVRFQTRLCFFLTTPTSPRATCDTRHNGNGNEKKMPRTTLSINRSIHTGKA